MPATPVQWRRPVRLPHQQYGNTTCEEATLVQAIKLIQKAKQPWPGDEGP